MKINLLLQVYVNIDIFFSKNFSSSILASGLKIKLPDSKIHSSWTSGQAFKIFTVVRTSNCKWWEEINALRHLYTLSIDYINFYIINS